jgi:hypothetical protein
MPLTFTNPSGGVTPLGEFAVTAGTPVALNKNVGPQGQSKLKMAKRFQQVMISCPTANTGDVYLVWGNNPAGTVPNAILAIISPGRAVPIPNGLLVNSKINIDNLWLDATAATQTAVAFAVYG